MALEVQLSLLPSPHRSLEPAAAAAGEVVTARSSAAGVVSEMESGRAPRRWSRSGRWWVWLGSASGLVGDPRSASTNDGATTS